MNSQAITALGLTGDWLTNYHQDSPTTLTTACSGAQLGSYVNYYQQYPYTYPVSYTSPARPIKLTLSEIERLRKVAKADDKIKAILAKFTSQIEIAVDFE